MDLTRLSVAEALASLRSRADGLTPDEVRTRLAEYGPNRLEELRRAPLWLRLAREFVHLFALILWVAAGIALLAELLAPGQGMATLGWAIVAVILINGVFSFLQEYRAERAVAALRALLPAQAKVVRESVVVLVPADQIVPGDVVVLQEGDEVPADARVIEAVGLRVNAATITGEAAAAEKHPHPTTAEDVAHARNLVLAGTAVVSGEGRALVFATGMRSEFGRIAGLAQRAVERPSPLQLEIRRLSRLVAALATLTGVVFFAIGRALGFPFWEDFIFAIGIIVANVPEGLLPTVTLSLAMATQRMARRNALIRHLPAVEALGSASVIVSDKTGTLTQNRMQVRALFFGGREHAWDRLDPALTQTHRRFFAVGLHCHDLREIVVDGRRRIAGDPMEVSLRSMGQRALGAFPVFPRVAAIPFDTDRRRLSTLHHAPEGLLLYCKGALEALLPLCQQVQDADGVVPLTGERREQYLAAEDSMAERGMRVLAFAWRVVPPECPRERWEEGLVLAGLVGMDDPPRAEVPAAIRICREAGIRVIMVTGDHPRTAQSVAHRIGLIASDTPRIVTGAELARLAPEQLQLVLDEPEILFARLAPEQKLAIVQALQRKREVVAVTGDVVNDAPALRQADIGVAMGLSGTDVAKEAADMVLLDDNFASIVAAVEEGRAVFENIRKFLTYILTSNIPELVPYLAFALLRIPLPLTIIQILAVDLGTDLLPALALGAEKPHPDLMRQPPRRHQRRLLDWRLVSRAYLWLGPLEAAGAMAAFFFVLDAGGWNYGEPLAELDPLYLQATTGCLAAIVVMQVANVFLCRHPVAPAWAGRALISPLLLWGVAAELALIIAIVYTSWGNLVFGTAPLALDTWLFMLPFAAGLFLLEEGRKHVARLRMRTPRG
jgi:sodium/potassium-transporting ATPase subunit alpha